MGNHFKPSMGNSPNRIWDLEYMKRLPYNIAIWRLMYMMIRPGISCFICNIALIQFMGGLGKK